jgi:hypothetical protein
MARMSLATRKKRDFYAVQDTKRGKPGRRKSAPPEAPKIDAGGEAGTPLSGPDRIEGR